MDDQSSPEQEKAEELQLLRERRDKLIPFTNSAIKKILTSDNNQQAQEGVYESMFFEIARMQLVAVGYRIRHSDYVEIEVKELVEWKKALEDIIQGGIWKEAKELVLGLVNFVSVTTPIEDSPYGGEEIGLTKEMVYKDQRLFTERGEVSNYKLVEEFVWDHLDLIPNRTKPYQHPHLDELKASVADL